MNVVQELSTEGQDVFHAIMTKLNINNLVKYIVQGVAVAIAAYVIPNRKTNMHEILIISTVAALTFFTLDIFTDDVAKGVRLGAGLGIGMSLVTNTPIPSYLSFM